MFNPLGGSRASARMVALGVALPGILFIPDWRQLAGNLVFFLTVVLAAGIFPLLVKKLPPFLYISAVIIVLHALVNPANRTFIGFIGLEGLKYGWTIALRLLCIVVLVNYFLLTTQLRDLIQAFSGLNRDLGIMIGMLFSILPVMHSQMKTTMEIQSVRGLIRNKNLIDRFRSFLIVITPTIVQSINRAGYMAQLLCLRGYSSAGKRPGDGWNRRDKALVLISLLYLAINVLFIFYLKLGPGL